MTRPNRMRWAAVAATVLGCGLLSPRTLRAEGFEFRPEAAVKGIYLDNVLFLGEAATDEKQSDLITEVSLVLPLVRRGSSTTVALSYTPSYQSYQDNPDLDHDEHRFEFDLRNSRSPVARSRLTLGLSRTWTSSTPRDPDSFNLFLTSLKERDLADLQYRYRRDLRNNWQAEFRARGKSYAFDEIVIGGPPQDAEDRDELFGVLGIWKFLTPVTQVGLEYEYRRFDYELSGVQNASLISLGLAHRTWQDAAFRFQLGGFQLNDQSDDPTVPDNLDNGFTGEISLDQQIHSTSLRLFARRTPSSAASFGGTRNTTSVGVTWTALPGPRVDWFVSARYGLRSALDSGGDDLTSVSLETGFERRWRDTMGLRAAADFRDQSGSNDPARNDSVLGGRVAFVWYPRGTGWLEQEVAR